MMPEFLLWGVNASEIALTLERVAVGAFFTISGYHKLFNPARHASVVQTFERLHIPCVRLNEWWVPGVELAAGFTLTLGLFSVVSAALLGAICLVASCTDGLQRIRDYQPIDKADWLDDALYLPEVLYGVMLLTVILAGPTLYSLDRVFFFGG